MKTIHVGDRVKFKLWQSWQKTLHIDGLVESTEYAPTYIVAVPVDYIRTKSKVKRYLVKLAEIEEVKGDEQHE